MNPTVKLYGAGLLIGLGALWWLTRKGNAEALGQSVATAAGSVGVGAVKGVGSVFGIPDTETAKCKKDRADGNWWAASFSCPTIEFAGGVGVGAVKGAGQVLGIPDTNLTQCQKDQAAGDWWAASFSCPALDFIGGVYGSTQINQAAARDYGAAVESRGPPGVVPRYDDNGYPISIYQI